MRWSTSLSMCVLILSIDSAMPRCLLALAPARAYPDDAARTGARDLLKSLG